MAYVKSLDGLRAIAVILVILFHYGLVSVGWIGVQIFFVLSGYLITTILLTEKGQPVGSYFQRFYWRRSVRIFPLYYGYLLAATLVYLIFKIPEHFPEWSIFLYTYTFNIVRPFYGHELTRFIDYFFGHLWSLAVEEQFYLIWPVIIYMFPVRILKKITISILVLTPLLRLGAALLASSFSSDPELGGRILYYIGLFQIDAFATGAAISLIPVPQQWQEQKLLKLGLILLLLGGQINNLILWLTVGKAYSISSLGYPMYMIHNLQYSWGYILININAALIILCCVRSARLSHLLEHRYLVQMGRVSYGMYVFHNPLLYIFKKYLFGAHMDTVTTVPGVLSFGLYIVTVYAVSQLSFTYFEQGFLRLKDRGPGGKHVLREIQPPQIG